MCNFRMWCALVALRDEGKVALSNVYHDCKNERIDHSTRKAFYEKLVAVADDTDPNSERQLDRLRELIEEYAEDFACSANVPALDASCSHFIPDFWLFADQVDGLRMGWAIDDTVSEDHLREIEAGRARWGTIPPKDFTRAWVTRTDSSDTVPRHTTETARKLREKLGLLRFLRIHGAYLMEIRYPRGAIPAGKLVPPTFLDGSTFVVYRSKIRSKDQWGIAVDLSDPDYSDGFPEAVHRKVAFTDQFEVRQAGLMQFVPHDPDAAKLHTSAPDPWQDDFAAELERYFT